MKPGTGRLNADGWVVNEAGQVAAVLYQCDCILRWKKLCWRTWTNDWQGKAATLLTPGCQT